MYIDKIVYETILFLVMLAQISYHSFYKKIVISYYSIGSPKGCSIYEQKRIVYIYYIIYVNNTLLLIDTAPFWATYDYRGYRCMYNRIPQYHRIEVFLFLL